MAKFKYMVAAKEVGVVIGNRRVRYAPDYRYFLEPVTGGFVVWLKYKSWTTFRPIAAYFDGMKGGYGKPITYPTVDLAYDAAMLWATEHPDAARYSMHTLKGN